MKSEKAVDDIVRENKNFCRMIWEHMRALLLLLRTSRFDLDFIRGWKMMKTAGFLPTSIFRHTSTSMTGVWHKTSVLLSFSAMKKYVSKCDSRTMTYLFCILDLFLPCCTPFSTAVSCACAFSACLSFYLFSLQPQNAGATIKSKSEKKNEWIGSCRVRTSHIWVAFFFSLRCHHYYCWFDGVYMYMIYVCARLPLLLCQRYSQRRCGCCHFFGWWWWNEDFGFIFIRIECERGERERDYDVFSRLPQWIFYDAIIWLWLWLSERSLFSPSSAASLASFFIQLLLTNKRQPPAREKYENKRPLLLPQRS